jgi:hypothetical protein
MNKIILKHREFKEKVIEAINNSQLPAFILKPVLKEILEQVEQIEVAQYDEALKLEQEEKNKKEEE